MRRHANTRMSFVRVLAAIVRSPERAIDSAADELAARDVTQLVSEQAAATPGCNRAGDRHRQLDVRRIGPRRRTNRSRLVGRGHAARSACRRDAGSLRRADRDRARRSEGRCGGCAVGRELPARADRRDDRSCPAVPRHLRHRRSSGTAGSTCDTTLPAIDPESAAYVLFTSGSTGEPKGVTMPHRALTNVIAWQNRRPSGAVGGSTLQFVPLSFDVSFQEIFSTLCGGGTLRLVSETQRKDLPALVRLVADEGIERIFLPFVALQAFAEAACVTRTRLESLRVVIYVGRAAEGDTGDPPAVLGESRSCPGEPVRPDRDARGSQLHHEWFTGRLSHAATDRHRDRRRNDQRARRRPASGPARNQG